MNTRRRFLKQAGTVAVGASVISGDTLAAAHTDTTAAYKGPHKMPTNAKLLAIRHADGSESLGAVTEAGVIDIRATAKKMGVAAPASIDELLRGGNADGLNRVIAGAKASGVPLLAEADIVHGRLFTNPGKIMCVGLNYRQHAKEIGMQPPRVPPLFNKYNNTLAGQNCVIKLPPKEVSTKFDYETELLIVIGKSGRDISEADALSYVAGYCTSNDFSARDLQLDLPNGQWMIGKTLDNFAPIGPYFVSSDLVGDPNKLKIETRVNGELRQSSSTADFIFNTQQMISYISKHWAIEPGDIIFTGTPQGVIAGMPKDKQVWLKAGDKLVSSIEKLGDLKFSLA
ncbi:MAG: fumarylacetoacetate hydrolase family protein [Herminiimonas sp.]|nr:fumarylacetoacetate hydrolase family protein [Herminiimonas sp.]